MKVSALVEYFHLRLTQVKCPDVMKKSLIDSSCSLSTAYNDFINHPVGDVKAQKINLDLRLNQGGFFRLPKTFLDHQSDNGMSALHHAAKENNVHMVKLLLKHGANINLEQHGTHCNSRDTPLNTAVQLGCLDVVSFLIAHEGIKWGAEETSRN